MKRYDSRVHLRPFQFQSFPRRKARSNGRPLFGVSVPGVRFSVGGLDLAQEVTYQTATDQLAKIVELFSSKTIPDVAARAISSNIPGIPSSKWSLLNRIAMLMQGTQDARGYHQWQDVGRNVKKGSHAIRILGPITKNIGEGTWCAECNAKECSQAGIHRPVQTFKRQALYGFKQIPVFRIEDTEGKELVTDYKPRELPPLVEVAERFGVSIKWENSLPRGVLGAYESKSNSITLASEDWDVFFHELAHAIHRSFEPKSIHGQDPEAEAIAELVAATLARLYGKDIDAFAWNYIAGYAGGANPDAVGKACVHVLTRAERVLSLIFLSEPKRVTA